MTHAELRRLAIRLARHIDRDDDYYCGECKEPAPPHGKGHTPTCPIAELEAEEAAPEKSDAQQRFEFVAKGIELGIFDERDMRSEYSAQLAAKVKPATKFEGEY